MVTAPVDFSKLGNVVQNYLVTKAVHDKLVAKVNKTETSGIVKKTDYNSKISKLENKIPIISGSVKTSGLTAVENKIPDVSSLAKKQIITQKLVKLERNLLIIVMINMLLLQSLID